MGFPDRLHGVCAGDHPSTVDGPTQIIVTSDGGETWTTVKTTFRPWWVAFPSVDLLHSSSLDGHFRSSNLGTSWDSSVSGGVFIRFPSPEFGFSESRRTTDSGRTWQRFDRAPIPNGIWEDAGFQDAATGYMSGSRDEGCFGAWSAVYVTEDSAKTWQLLFHNTGRHFPRQALRTGNGNWLVTFYDEEVYLRADGGFKQLGKFGSSLLLHPDGSIYGSKGYRSTDNGETFQKWVLEEELEFGLVVAGPDSSVYFTSSSDTRNWQTVGHIIYRIYSPSLAFGGKSSVHRSPEPDPRTAFSVHRGGQYRLPHNDGFELFNLIGLRVASSNEPTDHLSTADLAPGLYLLRLADQTQRLMIY